MLPNLSQQKAAPGAKSTAPAGPAQVELANRFAITTSWRKIEEEIDAIHALLIQERMANTALKKEMEGQANIKAELEAELAVIKALVAGRKRGPKKGLSKGQEPAKNTENRPLSTP